MADEKEESKPEEQPKEQPIEPPKPIVDLSPNDVLSEGYEGNDFGWKDQDKLDDCTED